MELYDVVTKLIGPIQPIGETNEDEKRLENLKVMTKLVDQLITDLEDVAAYSNRWEHSLRVAGRYAGKFLDGLERI